MLTKLGGYRVDRREKIEGLTLAGLLMFGKIDSITDIYCCPSYFPDYREYHSLDPQHRWTNRIYPDGNWEANLFQFYIRIIPKLSLVLPKPFELKNGIRIEDTPTHIALREALINTLIHCNYAVDSNITIEQRRDKYVFSNPGTLLIPISQYYRSPQIEEKTKPDKVILELPLVSLLSDEVIDHLKELFGKDIVSIDNNKLLTLATCCSEGEITNNRLQLVIDKHRSDITKLLRELCAGKYLISEGVGRGTKYKIAHPASNDDGNDTSNDDSKVKKTTSKAKKTTSRIENDASKEENDASKINNDASNAKNDASKINNNASKVDNNASKVENNASNQTSKKTNKVQKQILEVCANYLSLTEIAEKVNKSIPYLNNIIIPQFVRKGLLEREFPDTPRHPKQRYRTKK